MFYMDTWFPNKAPSAYLWKSPVELFSLSDPNLPDALTVPTSTPQKGLRCVFLITSALSLFPDCLPVRGNSFLALWLPIQYSELSEWRPSTTISRAVFFFFSLWSTKKILVNYRSFSSALYMGKCKIGVKGGGSSTGGNWLKSMSLERASNSADSSDLLPI